MPEDLAKANAAIAQAVARGRIGAPRGRRVFTNSCKSTSSVWWRFRPAT